MIGGLVKVSLMGRTESSLPGLESLQQMDVGDHRMTVALWQLQRHGLIVVTKNKDLFLESRQPASRCRFRGVGRILRPVGVIADAFSLRGAYQRDGNRIGRETTREVASISGSLAGGWAGAQAGAAIGALGGPVGVVVGGIVGGVIGGFLGSELGRSLF